MSRCLLGAWLLLGGCAFLAPFDEPSSNSAPSENRPNGRGDGLLGDTGECTAGATQDCYPGAVAEVGRGGCRAGVQTCVERDGETAWGGCEGAVEPAPESCGNGRDEDCDGETDEGCVCDDGATQSCWTTDDALVDVGLCRAGTQTCADGAWSACDGAVMPSPEECGDLEDDDCDGTADDGCDGGEGEPTPECVAGTTEACTGCQQRSCGDDGRWGACEGECETCWRCAGGNFDQESAFCGVEEVDANDDGSCPDGASHDPPECVPCWDCRTGNAYCPNAGCCGDFVETGIVGAGCTCYGCSGAALETSEDSSIQAAEDDSHANCVWPAGDNQTLCGHHRTGCWIASCGTAAECG